MIKKYYIGDTTFFFDSETLNLYRDELPATQNEKINEHREKDSLYIVTFFMTDQCNGRCKYCYEEHGNQRMKKAGADRAMDILKKKYKTIDRIRFFGGEPLLNFEMIKYIVDELTGKINVGRWEITTNAILMNSEILEFLEQHQFHIIISFDGPEFIHDYLRIGCKHENVLAWINKIKKTTIGKNLEINCTYTQVHANRINLDELEEYFNKLGVKYVVSNVITEKEEFKLEDTDENIKKEIDDNYKKMINKSWNSGVNFYVSCVINALVKRTYHNTFCQELEEGMAFNIEGREYPCTRLINKCNKKEEILAVNIKDNKVCNKCWAKGLCYYCTANIYLKENIPYNEFECPLKSGYDYAFKRFLEYLYYEPQQLQNIVNNFYA